MSRPLNKENNGAQSTQPDAVIMRTIIATILAIIIAALLLNSDIEIPHPPKLPEVSHSVEAKSVTPTPPNPTKQASITPEVPTKAPVAEVKPAPPPEVWKVTASPHGRVTVAQINEFLALLKARGVTKQGAAYLTGNFIAESYLLPCAAERGDGGQAWGLGQWHPTRRHDMPCELDKQLDWALDVEMPRDAAAGRYRSLTDILKDPAAGRADFLQGFKNWERYGVEGNRAAYGDAIMSQL